MSVIYGNPITLGGGGKPKKLLSSLTEGSLVSVLEDGKLVPFYVAKHNYEADLNGEGRTLLVREDAYGVSAWNSTNVNTYANSTVDTLLNGDYKGKLSSTVKAQMATTLFDYTVGNKDATLKSLARSVFLLSHTEFGVSYSGANTEGAAIPIASNVKIAYINGAATRQWTRSPNKSDAVNVAYIDTNGSGASGANANITSYAIRPCFTLPATMALNTEPYADGSWGLADEDVLLDTTTAKTTPLAPVNYTNGIADLTPAQLHEIAAAISSNPNINKDTSIVYYDKGDVHRKISTGDTQEILVANSPFVVKILGFNHHDLTLATAYGNPTVTGKAGMAFQLEDIIGTYSMYGSNTNVGGWKSSSIRVTHMASWLTHIETDVAKVLKSVNITTSEGNKSSNIVVTEDVLFHPSEVEVFGTTTLSFAGEGSQYAYYKAGNSKIKKYQGTNTNWWLRSPCKNTNTSFVAVNTSGVAADYYSSTTYGSPFVYCI